MRINDAPLALLSGLGRGWQPRVSQLRSRSTDQSNEVFVRTASRWEVATKSASGQLAIDVSRLRQAALDDLTARARARAVPA